MIRNRLVKSNLILVYYSEKILHIQMHQVIIFSLYPIFMDSSLRGMTKRVVIPYLIRNPEIARTFTNLDTDFRRYLTYDTAPFSRRGGAS